MGCVATSEEYAGLSAGIPTSEQRKEYKTKDDYVVTS